MPKQRITKEMIIDAAFQLLREGGMERILVKNIAEKIGCSVQPIYSYCKNMEGLHRELAERSAAFTAEYIRTHIDKEDLFRSTGYAYLNLAKEEPMVFKLFALRHRDGITSLNDLYQKETNPMIAEVIAENLQIPVENAKNLHIAMMIFNVGIGTILSSTSPGIPALEMETQLEIACQAFLQYFKNLS